MRWTRICVAAIAEIAARRKVEVQLDPGVAQAADRISIPNWSTRWRMPRNARAIRIARITSGAGHDACNLNTVMPAAMVFVPCKDGISHNELEDATQA